MTKPSLYIIKAAEKQEAYDHLQKIAAAKHDAVIVKDKNAKRTSAPAQPDPLTYTDILIYSQAHPDTCGITLYDPALMAPDSTGILYAPEITTPSNSSAYIMTPSPATAAVPSLIWRAAELLAWTS